MPTAEEALSHLSHETPIGAKLRQQKNLRQNYPLLYKPFKLFYNYYYSCPVVYYSQGEALIYHIVTITLVVLVGYYLLWVVPWVLVKWSEGIFYYVTGSRANLSVVTSLWRGQAVSYGNSTLNRALFGLLYEMSGKH
ncbi:uncharacterized protein LODBEIA_P59940 [Lodderomyces beijingensis]|uniref:Uncharacterized protein n=1 Tax=Lodderomyces beijingensis TaxID=1775926 RepID=A0ABP0ZUF1_9ASCO